MAASFFIQVHISNFNKKFSWPEIPFIQFFTQHWPQVHSVSSPSWHHHLPQYLMYKWESKIYLSQLICCSSQVPPVQPWQRQRGRTEEQYIHSCQSVKYQKSLQKAHGKVATFITSCFWKIYIENSHFLSSRWFISSYQPITKCFFVSLNSSLAKQVSALIFFFFHCAQTKQSVTVY